MAGEGPQRYDILRDTEDHWIHNKNNKFHVDGTVRALPGTEQVLLNLIIELLNKNPRMISEKISDHVLSIGEPVILTPDPTPPGSPAETPPGSPAENAIPNATAAVLGSAAAILSKKLLIMFKDGGDKTLEVFSTDAISSLFLSSSPMQINDANFAAILQYLLGRAVQRLGEYFTTPQSTEMVCVNYDKIIKEELSGTATVEHFKELAKKLAAKGASGNAPGGASGNAPAGASGNAPGNASGNAPENAPAGASGNASSSLLPTSSDQLVNFKFVAETSILTSSKSTQPLFTLDLKDYVPNFAEVILMNFVFFSFCRANELVSVAVGTDDKTLLTQDALKAALASFENHVEGGGRARKGKKKTKIEPILAIFHLAKNAPIPARPRRVLGARKVVAPRHVKKNDKKTKKKK